MRSMFISNSARFITLAVASAFTNLPLAKSDHFGKAFRSFSGRPFSRDRNLGRATDGSAVVLDENRARLWVLILIISRFFSLSLRSSATLE